MNQIDRARALIEHIAEHLRADLSVELWNGEILPLGRNARRDILIRIASPAAIGQLLRSPRLTTLVEIYLAGQIDIVGASPLEAIGRWDHLDAVHLKRNVDKVFVLRNAIPFLAARAPRDAGLSFAARVRRIAGRGRDDEAMVQFHYDVSNAFYRLFLGEEMQYSAGNFASPTDDLDEAQCRKLDLICTKLQLKPGSRLLDVGCGWGGLAAHAAERYGAIVHGVTLSTAQLAEARMRTAKFGDQVRLELRDYRSLDQNEAYDAISQIGMFEHVGIDNHDAFFAQMARLLVPGGLYLHQAITRRAPRKLGTFRRKTSYMKVINRWIFPGGELDYVGMTTTNLERWGFELRDIESMREHYYLSLKAWSERLYARREEATAEAGSMRTRLWLLYFALCCTGFWRGVLCDFQILSQKKVTGLSNLPLQRQDGGGDGGRCGGRDRALITTSAG